MPPKEKRETEFGKFGTNFSPGTFDLTAVSGAFNGSRSREFSPSGGNPRRFSVARRRSVLPNTVPAFVKDQDTLSGSEDDDDEERNYNLDTYRPTIFNVEFPGYENKQEEQRKYGEKMVKIKKGSDGFGSIAGTVGEESDIFIRDSDQVLMDSQAIQFTVRFIVRQEPLNFQVKFTPPVQKLTETAEFENLIKGFSWLGIFALKRRWYPSSVSSWAKEEEGLFGALAVCYGRLFESVKLDHDDNPNHFIEFRDSCMSPLPFLVAKCSFYLVSTFFSMVEDDGRMDSKLRHLLITRCYIWMNGVAPQRIDLKGWPKKEHQRKVKRKRKDFNPEALSQRLDAVAQPQARKFAHLASLTARSGMAPLASSQKGRGNTPSGGPDYPSLLTLNPSQAKEALAEQASRLPATARESRTLTSGESKKASREVVPQHVSYDRWYESGGRLVGHLTAQRSGDGKPKRVNKSLETFSPFMQHYFSAQHMDARAQPGGKKTMSWTSLTKMDRQGQKLVFTNSTEKSNAVADRIALQDRVAQETFEDHARREIVTEQRSRRFWEGKGSYVVQQLKKQHSHHNPEAIELREQLHKRLASALTSKEADVFDQLKSCQKALAQSRKVLFQIPVKYRTPLHKLTAKIFAKMRALERMLPLMAEKKNTLKRFGETINFDQGTIDDLDSIFQAIIVEEEEALDKRLMKNASYIQLPARLRNSPPAEDQEDLSTRRGSTSTQLPIAIGSPRSFMGEKNCTSPVSPRPVDTAGSALTSSTMDIHAMEDFLSKTLTHGYSLSRVKGTGTLGEEDFSAPRQMFPDGNDPEIESSEGNESEASMDEGDFLDKLNRELLEKRGLQVKSQVQDIPIFIPQRPSGTPRGNATFLLNETKGVHPPPLSSMNPLQPTTPQTDRNSFRSFSTGSVSRHRVSLSSLSPRPLSQHTPNQEDQPTLDQILPSIKNRR